MAELKQDKETIAFALDIEKAGPKNLSHPIVAVGHSTAKGSTIIDRGLIKLQVTWPTIDPTTGKVTDYGDFEKQCWDEFWSNPAKMPPALMEELKTNAVPQAEGFKQFAALLDKLEQDYPKSKYKIKFISNNPSYDVAAVDVMLELYCKRNPMRYNSDGKYRGLSDSYDMLSILPANLKKKFRDEAAAQAQSTAVHDHNPQNDAETILVDYLAAKLAKKFLAEWFAEQS